MSAASETLLTRVKLHLRRRLHTLADVLIFNVLVRTHERTHVLSLGRLSKPVSGSTEIMCRKREPKEAGHACDSTASAMTHVRISDFLTSIDADKSKILKTVMS